MGSPRFDEIRLGDDFALAGKSALAISELAASFGGGADEKGEGGGVVVRFRKACAKGAQAEGRGAFAIAMRMRIGFWRVKGQRHQQRPRSRPRGRLGIKAVAVAGD